LAVVALPVLLGHSLAGKVALAGGAAVLVLAVWLPRVTLWAMRIVAVLAIASLPALLRALAVRRDAFVGLIKPSGINRLEIWDYMTARVAERPLLGWGLMSSDRVPITARELAGYHYVTAAGIYPHDQFLQAWLELGALGAACLLGLVLLALCRIPRLPAGLACFALAATAAAALIASVNYEITTDSWWAALTATVLLFRLAAA
ncbi:MAG: O-antigen ligase family protein, partial [Rhodospirillales bacterium]|nr:O-antigen ligase family protein [Rhodospirillales bacterium]